MNTEELRNPYDAFFNKNAAGQHYVNELRRLIVSNHAKAEQDPDRARDYTQRAAGAREALDHITSVLTATSKGGKAK